MTGIPQIRTRLRRIGKVVRFCPDLWDFRQVLLFSAVPGSQTLVLINIDATTGGTGP
ncbi:hypothetical protein [Amycolatopsis sp. DSM 110486]|uniref:hypothetical protein n=1 Tax=Amycolatopsis sp. DSM 110486 TaxID=2865832 RepID=UPI001C694E22|nr:hypothetical protein [Amycolatopsis sp. DSM 110486]QYN20461.1 hypothetical protein K1T34_49590 [Amycolatopsis sp. DSM 110486]